MKKTKLVVLVSTGLFIFSHSVRGQEGPNLLSERYTKEVLKEVLVSVEAWHPFPRVLERDGWEKLSQNIREGYIKQAERLLDADWETPKASVFLEYVRNGNRSNFQSVSFGRRAQLAELVRELPDGLDTLIGRSGIRLSGGQRQRLAVARMVLSKPSVVILDEATSALDSTTEQHLHQALQGLLAGRTTLIVAHRLSAVRQADRVLVFEDGRIVEQGRHEQLMADGGLYASLYRSQEAEH